MAIDRTIKTNLALQYIQDSILTGQPVQITKFKVSEILTQNLTPDIILGDINPSWYTGMLSTSPMSLGSNIRMDLVLPQNISGGAGKLVREIYIIGEYNNEEFLFGVIQSAETEIYYTTSSSLYLTVVFTLSHATDVNINIESEVLEYTETLLANAWSTGVNPIYQSVNLIGLLNTDSPVISLIQSGDYGSSLMERINYNYIFKASCSTDTLTFYAENEITMDLNVQIKIMRSRDV